MSTWRLFEERIDYHRLEFWPKIIEVQVGTVWYGYYEVQHTP